ncbi:MAG TPA: glucuronate isomerase [Chloroflexota bacterium]|nr:glucuronate isomerase [Chloroflexota bacterium]
MTKPWTLSPDRCFDADPAQRQVARGLYAAVKGLPLVCPHGHVDPALLADPAARFTSPAELFVIPDHYVFRMLYSQGVALEDLGVPARDGSPVERDHRRIWQRFAEHFYLFRATPTGLWLSDELITVFGVEEKLNGASAQRIYDHIAERLTRPEFTLRALFARFDIEVLCTTDPATSDLAEHRRLRDEGYDNIRPTFRPDAVVHLDAVGWRDNVAHLAEVAGIEIVDYASFIRALEAQRARFKSLGATATDHSCVAPYTARLSPAEAGAIFDRALRGAADGADAARFTAHMLMEMARMSVEDGLVMQIHAGSRRDYNAAVFARFGPDKGADIPVKTDWTNNLHALLDAYGNDRRFRVILFTLDESTYSRELAPLAGHYPAVLLGPPWWFYDSVNGMTRYLDLVVETAGLRNTAGFNDDTRAFASIPSRHDVWRRVTCNWLAGLVVRGLLDEEDALEMAHDCAYHLARRAYNLDPNGRPE